LAELLGVSPPTVTNTLKRMARDGLVALDDPQGPRLTETGWKAASSVMRRHMLIEWLLTRMVGWAKSHSQAHELEHVVSAELEKALRMISLTRRPARMATPCPGSSRLWRSGFH